MNIQTIDVASVLDTMSESIDKVRELKTQKPHVQKVINSSIEMYNERWNVNIYKAEFFKKRDYIYELGSILRDYVVISPFNNITDVEFKDDKAIIKVNFSGESYHEREQELVHFKTIKGLCQVFISENCNLILFQ